MSLALSSRRNDYVGNGTTTDFAYEWRILDEDYIRVVVKSPAGEETVLTIDDDYTVGSTLSQSGDNITLIEDGQEWMDAGDGGLKDDWTISLIGNTPLTQITDIRNQGSYYPSLHEDFFDKIVMIAQEQQNQIDGSVRLPDTVDPEDFDVRLPSNIVESADLALFVKGDGSGFEFRDSNTLDTQTSHDVLNNTSDQVLSGESYDGLVVSSMLMEVEIRRGTTVAANVPIAMQYLNSTWRVIVGGALTGEAHGVTFNVNQTGTTGQLRASLDNNGAGNGTIKIRKQRFTF